MYHKILLPIDGSEISTQSARVGIDLAKQFGASVLLLNVTQPFSSLVGFDGIAAAYAFSNDEYEQSARQEAQAYFEPILVYAREQGVPVSTLIELDGGIADCIVRVSKEQSCDLVHIASHGRSGLTKLLLGSVTAKVLSLAQTSILVYRP